MGTSPTTGTPYMAVEGGSTEMATFDTPQTSLSIYWGSIDGTPGGNLNTFSITVDGYTLTGAIGGDEYGGKSVPVPATNSILRATSWLQSPVLLHLPK